MSSKIGQRDISMVTIKITLVSILYKHAFGTKYDDNDHFSRYPVKGIIFQNGQTFTSQVVHPWHQALH